MVILRILKASLTLMALTLSMLINMSYSKILELEFLITPGKGITLVYSHMDKLGVERAILLLVMERMKELYRWPVVNYSKE